MLFTLNSKINKEQNHKNENEFSVLENLSMKTFTRRNFVFFALKQLSVRLLDVHITIIKPQQREKEEKKTVKHRYTMLTDLCVE